MNTVTVLSQWNPEQVWELPTPGALSADRYVPFYINIYNSKGDHFRDISISWRWIYTLYCTHVFIYFLTLPIYTFSVLSIVPVFLYKARLVHSLHTSTCYIWVIYVYLWQWFQFSGTLLIGNECDSKPYFTRNITIKQGDDVNRLFKSWSSYGAKYLYDCPVNVEGNQLTPLNEHKNYKHRNNLVYYTLRIYAGLRYYFFKQRYVFKPYNNC